MASDRLVGAGILVVSVIVILVYLIWVLIAPLAPSAFPDWFTSLTTQLWFLRAPVLVAVFALGGIAAWIGWTILTTPPPKPIEEIQKEIEQELSKESPPPPPEKNKLFYYLD
jgi:Predicted transcription regulator containing HTH domain